MLTISSVAVSPLPQQAPTAKAQPVTPVKTSNAVSSENAGVSVVVAPAGDGGRAEPVYAPQAFPPVTPTGESAVVNVRNNAAAPERVGEVAASAVAAVAVGQSSASTEAEGTNPVRDAAQAQAESNRSEPAGNAQAEQARAQARAQVEVQRFKGEFPREVKSPTQEALDTQINELLPNMWKASRAAVDMLIGEEAKAAAAARAEVLAPQPEVPSERALDATDNYVRTGSEPSLPGGQVDKRV